MTAAGDPGLHDPAPAGPPAALQCFDEVCVTCADLAVPARVVRLLPDAMAEVAPEPSGRELSGGEPSGPGSADPESPAAAQVVREEVSVALVPRPVAPGDTVLVHAGEAIGVVDR